MTRFIRTTVFLPIILMLLSLSCQRGESPKPRAYFRIAMPEKSYQDFDTVYPYRFEYPEYATFKPDNREPYWGDIVFPEFNGRIHLSYKPVNNPDDLAGYFEDARTFVHRHIPKATSIRDEMFVHEDQNVYGMLFHIKGREAASALQFFATDSTDHFIRGALYFDATPNNDSLSPVISFIEEDIRHLIETMSWE
ncbi:MAG: gliding motility lipoprotein GldD [Bacteroidales bacterium]